MYIGAYVHITKLILPCHKNNEIPPMFPLNHGLYFSDNVDSKPTPPRPALQT